ncbi:hypothetical protein [Xanthomonas phaseoli]|uniref:hypothetical protein n=2 Tax=Xanthomonas phaseoli TaxID=1985254 RepID=UPI00037FF6A0|nr:hypothetical protein [Xanthomonas phaseoli]
MAQLRVSLMPKFCSECGSELREVGDFRSCWFSVYECTSGAPLHDFIAIGDAQRVFPLLPLSLGVKQRLVGAEPSLITLAASRIQTIDYKTVSIVQFEHTLLGCYKDTGSIGAAS